MHCLEPVLKFTIRAIIEHSDVGADDCPNNSIFHKITWNVCVIIEAHLKFINSHLCTSQ
ncbi:hypothetical protein PVAP13_2KG452810 [Panicum virgatum]|uniref:Uncharacterized protein n=1 Tax=Panicum virgatum TaxID=38727 RepID=A0A8T0WI47_PANVG|nr:hypothetical protein PVAP13_2KG452810 [Panicum virgatum]